MMNELDIEKELIYDEPTNATSDPGPFDTGNNASVDAAPSTNGGAVGSAGPGAATGNGAKPNGRPHAGGLGKSFADIAAAGSAGQYPALDRIFGPTTVAGSRAIVAERAARQRAERRQLESHAHESTFESASGRLIEDVRPGMFERMAVAESRIIDNHDDIKELRRDIHDGVKQAVQLAADDNRVLDRRIDREILPAIAQVARKNTTKLVVSTAIAFIAFAANLLQLYYYFIVKHL